MKNETNTEACIRLQTEAVIRLIAEKYGKPLKEAGEMLLKSETYKILKDPKTGLWGESKLYILNYFDKELQGVPREER